MSRSVALHCVRCVWVVYYLKYQLNAKVSATCDETCKIGQSIGNRHGHNPSAASYPPYRGTGTSCQAPGCAASGLFGGWFRPPPNRANGLSRLQWGSTRSPRGCLTLDMVGYHGRGLGISAQLVGACVAAL
eukprot:scaffold88621_cov60-Phaeocystis_antarctica.AAC.1